MCFHANRGPKSTLSAPCPLLKKYLNILFQIISAGSKGVVNHWSVNGERRMEIPCTPTSVFSLSFNYTSNSYKVNIQVALYSHWSVSGEQIMEIPSTLTSDCQKRHRILFGDTLSVFS